MATNPMGKGTKTIGLNMKKPMADEIERRAKSMQISTGAYCKIILKKWLESGEKLELMKIIFHIMSRERAWNTMLFFMYFFSKSPMKFTFRSNYFSTMIALTVLCVFKPSDIGLSRRCRRIGSLLSGWILMSLCSGCVLFMPMKAFQKRITSFW